MLIAKSHKNKGGFIGTTGSYQTGGLFSLSDEISLTYFGTWNSIPRNGLVLQLDASLVSSYPRTGTTWYDLSGYGNHFTLNNAGAYTTTGTPYMDFNGTYGASYTSTDIALGSTTPTYMVWTRVKNSSADWRTLTRSVTGTADHHVIILAGGWNIGTYNNGNGGTPGGFNDSGYSQQSLPNYNTSNWMCMYFRFGNSNPYLTMSYNDTPGTTRASITTSGAQYGSSSFGSLGAYNANGYPSTSQYWGDIGSFYMWNRTLSDAELLNAFNATRSRFGI